MARPVYDNEKLCLKIKEIFPDLGECGIDVKVDFDEAANAYAVRMKGRDGQDIKTFLDADDAALCMAGDRCVKLSVQVGQVKGK